MKRWVSGIIAVATLTAGCGSTVQVKGSMQVGGNGSQGLSADLGGTQQPAGGTQPTVPGSGTLPGASTTSGGTVPGAVGGTSSQGPQGSIPTTAGTTASGVTGPIQLGFMTTTVGNAQSFGLNVGQTFSDQQLYDGLIKEINARGGLAGRKILPVYGATDTASSDWNTQFQAACSHLTQDNKVQAVLGYIFVFLDSFEQCLAKHRVPHFYGGYQPGDVQAQRDFPGVVSTAHPTVEVANLTVLKGAIQTGHLTRKSKLGILTDSCAHGDRAFAQSTVPYLKSQGINYEVTQMSCATGSGDVGSAAAAIKSAELAFAAHGVDTVFAGGVALLLFMENAESQAYRPSYLTSVGGAALQPNAPAAQLANLHGFGWLPAVDTDPAHQPAAPRPAQQACLSMLKHQGLTPQAYNDFMFAYITCDALALYGKALVRTGGRTTPADIQQAYLAEMPSFKGAATYEGRLLVGPGQRGGPGRWREYGWTGGCSCFTYRGPSYAVPTL